MQIVYKLNKLIKWYLVIIFLFLFYKITIANYILYGIIVSALLFFLFPISFIFSPILFVLFENYSKIFELQIIYFYLPLIFKLLFLKK